MSAYTTKVTCVNGSYFCCVFKHCIPLVQAKVKTREDIGPAFRDILRTIDKCGGDEFTSAASKRKNKVGNKEMAVKHIWCN
jgi:hypothetical protein